MIGKRSSQHDLFEVGNVFALELKKNSFHAQLAQVAPDLFSDEEFAALYSSSKGRPSVPPSQMALLTILQTYHKVSDDEAVERSAFDLRWCAVLRRPAGSPLCAKSTHQVFRAQLVLHKGINILFKRSLDEARRNGLLPKKQTALRAALDTKPILGRGAVEDTYNLMATAMVRLARAIAQHKKMKLQDFLRDNSLERLGEPSIKGTADIDWSDKEAQEAFLTGLASDARRIMALADGGVPQIKEAAELIEQIMLQDIEEHAGDFGATTAKIKQGTAKGRIPSATDPEQRHGRKSASKRFTGSKASVASDPGTALILAVEVLAGDDPDATGALDLVDAAEANTECTIDEVLADCAYGGGDTRQEFADAERELIAKVPAEPDRGVFPKSAFSIKLPVSGMGLEHARAICPGGNMDDGYTKQGAAGVTLHFGPICNACSLRPNCTTSINGRSLHLHPQEALLQRARDMQKTEEGRAKLRQRLGVENALARLAQLGIGQARYFGHAKTRFQLMMAATVANLRRTWNWTAAKAT